MIPLAITRIVEQASVAGVRTLDNGTRLYGQLPGAGPEAYAHVTFRGLAGDEIMALERSLGARIPVTYQDILSDLNGALLFGGALSLFGLRTDLGRSGANPWRPHSLVTPNTVERHPNASTNDFTIGSLRADGSRLVIDRETGTASMRSRDSWAVQGEWPDLETALSEVIQRLALTVFDRERREAAVHALRLSLSLEYLISARVLEAVVTYLANHGYVVCVDYGTVSEEVDFRCSPVGAAKRGPRGAAASALGFRRMRHFTCVLDESRSALSAALAEAALSRVLRIRSFQSRPDDVTVSGWDTDAIWDCETLKPEEETAALVIAVADDGSAIVLRGQDELVTAAESLLIHNLRKF